jgi:WLM domain
LGLSSKKENCVEVQLQLRRKVCESDRSAHCRVDNNSKGILLQVRMSDPVMIHVDVHGGNTNTNERLGSFPTPTHENTKRLFHRTQVEQKQIKTMAPENSLSQASIIVHASYRGEKLPINCDDATTAYQLKCLIAQQYVSSDRSLILPSDLKLFYKGKVMNDDNQCVISVFNDAATNSNEFASTVSASKQREYKIMATGISREQQQKIEQEIQDGIQRSKFNVKDALTELGKLAIKTRNHKGKINLKKSASRVLSKSKPKFGFGRIETLQDFPNESTAKKILETLANDPGIIACMTKHQWHVPVLSELYPEGQVGQSAECVMGYNTNNGQLIKLRLRTDDLQGFRKILNIRKVLYHELAHNVYSDHDSNFFQMMRQIENECTEYDWTKGAGLSSADDDGQHQQIYNGGSYLLGDKGSKLASAIPIDNNPRELAARAAELRMRNISNHQNDVDMICGCGSNKHNQDIFLPRSLESGSSPLQSDSEIRDKNRNKH